MLSACIGNTVATQYATPVPAGMWKTENYRVPGANTGLLVLSRDTGHRGSGCIPEISLDGESVASLEIAKRLDLHLTAGRHILRAAPNFNCAANVEEIYVDITEAETTNYRLGFVQRQMFLVPVGGYSD
jgi:hypothetical protein